MQTTTGLLSKIRTDDLGRMICVGGCNFMAPSWRKMDALVGEKVIVEWSVDRDGVAVASSIEPVEDK